jgi:parallel beta-helix repeat protein
LLIDSDNNAITRNKISENEDGIELQDSCYNDISKNIIISNIDHGFKFIGSTLELCTNNTIEYNTIKQNNLGIYLENSSNNIILKNNLLQNNQDAFFNKSKQNTWKQNYWNRPRILPKLIFGTIILRNLNVTWFNIDWHPRLRPYDTL